MAVSFARPVPPKNGEKKAEGSSKRPSKDGGSKKSKVRFMGIGRKWGRSIEISVGWDDFTKLMDWCGHTICSLVMIIYTLIIHVSISYTQIYANCKSGRVRTMVLKKYCAQQIYIYAQSIQCLESLLSLTFPSTPSSS